MRKLVPFVLLLAVVACKKKEPEVAATPRRPRHHGEHQHHRQLRRLRACSCRLP
ncbi:MAG: hypothetical protein IPI35_22105 [Deltaproteobacteria bacterium]|nr:hypothetical protein [Deltaproteobacteria bacterium]